ncbi:MAG: glucuronate isomerase [Clostridia bacterium]|nr:glucuronate isomerase [Clostridia bacterium]
MKKFMDRDFLLTTKTAKEIYKRGAEKTPIFDWHCHLSPKEIYEDKKPRDIYSLWLSGDHYKWRAMRSYGVPEEFVTGRKSGHDKFLKYAEIMPYCIGNPLYHWTHLELQRYFGITETLSAETAEKIWQSCNEQIKKGGFSPRELITRSNVSCVCTTDDPADSLEYHLKLKEDKSFKCKVLPAFRPDKAIAIEQPAFIPWLAAMEKTAGREITSYSELKNVLRERIEFFDSVGCCASDHALSYVPYAEANSKELEQIFKKGVEGKKLSTSELDKYKTSLLQFLAEEYCERDWAMELHIGAMRNNNTKMFQKLGPDTGYDSVDDYAIAQGLSRFMDSLEAKGKLPKTVLFTLNPKDNFVLGTMLGNFQSSKQAGKIQFGSAWWFNDNYDGMRQQITTLANLGVLGKFVGMITDSRSFLSYPRHEYFRRILCEIIGDWVEEGKYPENIKFLSKLVEDVSFNNAYGYFNLEDK